MYLFVIYCYHPFFSFLSIVSCQLENTKKKSTRDEQCSMQELNLLIANKLFQLQALKT
jgi:hypothetical protein